MANLRDTVSGFMHERPKRAGTTRRPYQRMFAIHRAISEGGYPNCSTLAKLLEVTPKTIQRDIDFMRDNFGVVIEYDDKLHGFRQMDTISDFPGFVMGAEELAALFLTRTALESIRGTALEKTMREIFAKIVLPIEGNVRLSWSDLDDAFTRKMPEMKARDVRLFGELAEAVIKQHEVSFHYRKLDADKAAARRVRPYHLGEVDGAWYLIGHDIERGGLRTFALPRMSRSRVLATRFERPVEFDGRDYLRRSFGIWRKVGEQPHLVRVRLKDYAARLAQERRWHPTQEVKVLDHKGMKVELCFEAGALEEVVRWVLSFGSKAEVLGPPELRQMVREELKLMKA